MPVGDRGCEANLGTLSPNECRYRATMSSWVKSYSSVTEGGGGLGRFITEHGRNVGPSSSKLDDFLLAEPFRDPIFFAAVGPAPPGSCGDHANRRCPFRPAPGVAPKRERARKQSPRARRRGPTSTLGLSPSRSGSSAGPAVTRAGVPNSELAPA